MHTASCHKTLDRHWGAAILSACMAVGLLATPEGAYAARQKKTTDAATHQPAKKHRAVKVKHQRTSSEESTAERDRRLYRECKGLPNAGACLGYTQR